MASGGGGSFISKPARGWLHPDHLVSKEGITYAVRVSWIFLKIEIFNFELKEQNFYLQLL